MPRFAEEASGERHAENLRAISHHLDLSPETLRQTLEVAMASGLGYPRIEGPDERGRMRLSSPIPPHWQSLVDDTLRIERRGSSLGTLPAIVFDPAHFLDASKGRPVFRPAPDTVLLHLGHPLFHHALATLARLRFPGSSRKANELSASRWTVRLGEIPPGMDALLLLTVEELAVNELREPFHHWVRTYRIPVSEGNLLEPLPYQPPSEDTPAGNAIEDTLLAGARHIWEDAELDLRRFVDRCSIRLTETLTARLESVEQQSITAEGERYRQRLKEVERAMSENTIAKITKERDALLADMQQLSLLEVERRAQEEKLRDLDAELQRRSSHFHLLLDRLRLDQERVLTQVLPKRFRLRPPAQVFPVAVEIRLPGQVR